MTPEDLENFPSERFVAFFNTPEEGCWEWKSSLDWRGYGKFWWKGHTHSAHRLSYAASTGIIPDGLSVLHTCDNRRCVRPSHLFLGTQDDNMKDMASKGRANGGRRLNLTPEQKQEICTSSKHPKMLAIKYKVSLSTIKNIRRASK